MNPRPDRTFLKYLALQVPGWLMLLGLLLALGPRMELSVWTAGLILGLWVAKDLALYPLLRRAYEDDPRTGGERLVGLRGVAATHLAPHGYIRVRGELWKAKVRPPAEFVPEGSAVRIHAARGLALDVERD